MFVGDPIRDLVSVRRDMEARHVNVVCIMSEVVKKLHTEESGVQ